ncbi:MAG: sucrose-6-phosphate hydrolase, partial [Tissierellia bacterium]|nr:sucrose-6-phosphate hydrolase [Tissierellia bacterium]
ELYYTGNTRNLQGIRHPYQVKAELGAKEVVNKRVIIDGIPKAYTEHFRDPKVIKKADIYYMIIGAQRENLTGAALMYTSKDSENWEFAYEVKTEYEDLGYMWECPDLTQVEGKDVLLFCPQGSMNTPIEKENLYPSVYLLGDYNFETGYFNNDKAVEKLDYGFDFYAAQTFSDENNDTVLIAWVGMPEIAYPSDKFGWAHVLTLPRKLKVIDGVLHQIPHPNLKKLRDRKITSLENVSLYELKINDIKESLEIQLYSKDNESLKLTYNKEERKVILDRSNFKESFGEKYGQMREIYMRNDLNSIHVFRDTSTIEIFLNNGEYTMTARFFPQIIEGDIIIEPQVQAEVYLLKEDIHDL